MKANTFEKAKITMTTSEEPTPPEATTEAEQDTSSTEPSETADNTDKENTEGDHTPSKQKADPKPKSAKKRLSKRAVLISLVILVNLLATGSSSYLFVASSKAKPVQVKSQTLTKETSDTTVSPASEPTTPTVTTKHYTAEALKTDFDYPSDWYIASNGSDQIITIQSPHFQIKELNGKLSDAQVVIDITPKYSDNNYAFIYDDSRIVMPSEKLTYTNPTKVQRTETNLSFAQFPGTTDKNGLDILFVSGDQSYATGQTVGSKTYKTINPFIAIYIQDCFKGCQALSTAQIDAATYRSTDMLTKAKDIVKSLRFN